MRLLLLAFVILTLFKSNTGDNETTLNVDELVQTTTDQLVLSTTEEIASTDSTSTCSSCAAIGEDPGLTTKLSNVSSFTKFTYFILFHMRFETLLLLCSLVKLANVFRIISVWMVNLWFYYFVFSREKKWWNINQMVSYLGSIITSGEGILDVR